jgi:hypothetical protein
MLLSVPHRDGSRKKVGGVYHRRVRQLPYLLQLINYLCSTTIDTSHPPPCEDHKQSGHWLEQPQDPPAGHVPSETLHQPPKLLHRLTSHIQMNQWTAAQALPSGPLLHGPLPFLLDGSQSTTRLLRFWISIETISCLERRSYGQHPSPVRYSLGRSKR